MAGFQYDLGLRHLVRAHIAIVGSGSIARSVAIGLAVLADGPMQVTIIARNRRAANEVAFVAGIQADLLGKDLRVRTVAAELDGAIGTVIADAQPEVIMHAASLQSPWEGRRRPSAWTRLLDLAGFGFTLPLHTDFAIRVATAAAQSGSGTRFVNACFPDAVNPVLTALGLAVEAGIGNAAVIASTVKHALGPGEDIRVLAHHRHLSPPGDPGRARDPQVWRGDVQVSEVESLLSDLRGADRERLSLVIGFEGAQLLRALTGGDLYRGSLPGPGGLPGGYPVYCDRLGTHLDLPASLSLPDAIAWNREAARNDGVDVADDRVTFHGTTYEAMREYLPQYGPELPIAQLQQLTGELINLRERLRRSA